MEYSRRDERIKTMQAFYQVFLYIENKEEYDATEILTMIYDVDTYKECPVFSQLVYALGLDHFDEIKKVISDHLVNWTFDRLDNVCKGILFVALTEGLYLKKAPRKVVINEAVTIAKNFLKENDHRFVNALLDKAIPAYEYKGN
jgi:hypothetical protein